jgi:hypothetical protein
MLEQSLEFPDFLGTLEGWEFNCECHTGCVGIYACEF